MCSPRRCRHLRDGPGRLAGARPALKGLRPAPGSTRTSPGGGAARRYALLSVEAICALPVRGLAADQAHLHLWVTKDFLFESRQILRPGGLQGLPRLGQAWPGAGALLAQQRRAAHAGGPRGACGAEEESQQSLRRTTGRPQRQARTGARSGAQFSPGPYSNSLGAPPCPAGRYGAMSVCPRRAACSRTGRARGSPTPHRAVPCGPRGAPHGAPPHACRPGCRRAPAPAPARGYAARGGRRLDACWRRRCALRHPPADPPTSR